MTASTAPIVDDGAFTLAARVQAHIAVSILLCDVFLADDRMFLPYRPAMDLALVALAFGLLLPMLGRAVIEIWPLLFVGWCGISYVWSIDQFATQRQIVFTMPVLVVLLMAGSALGLRETLVALRRATVVVSVLTLLYLLAYRGAAWTPALDGAVGLRGPFGHKNGCGFFFAMVATVWFDRRSTTAGRAMLTVGCLGVLLSQSSTALVLLIGGLLGLAILRRHFGQAAGRRATSSLIAVMGSAGLTLALVQYLDVMTALIGRDVTLTGRVDIWAAVVPRVREHLALGVGFGAPWVNITTFNAPMFREIGFRPFHAHNGYLDTVLQIGVVGLVLLLGLWWIALRRCVRAANGGRPEAILVMVMLVLLLISGASETAPLLGAGLALVGLFGGAAARINAPAPPSAGSVIRPVAPAIQR